MTRARLPSGIDRRSGGTACAPVSLGPARLLARLRGESTGSMALEYALVAPAFIALLLGILHVALIYFAQEGLETTVEGAARLIMTGQAQTTTITSGKNTYTGMTAADYKNAICYGITAKDVNGNPVTYAKALPPFLTCDRLSVNVQVLPSGCTTPVTNTFTLTYDPKTGAANGTAGGYGSVACGGSTNANNGLSGSQGDLVVLQLTYLWPTASLPMGFNLVNINGNRVLLATYVFTVESYLCSDGTTATC